MHLQMLTLRSAVLCAGCQTISNVTGDTCPGCGANGSLLSLSRVLNPSPELGVVTFVLSSTLTESASNLNSNLKEN